jgi:hypothetical protein
MIQKLCLYFQVTFVIGGKDSISPTTTKILGKYGKVYKN